ncbi:hypothetical protein Vafri_3890 [Volvox africanus]|uniref:Uncharacterized protein n=1 Tax=Volvox africanus TaxID=51714 RepID=A0A8J4AUF5_9CHLO|nr:hypothetical protein Vafri_3890 [Volvox africanus]
MIMSVVNRAAVHGKLRFCGPHNHCTRRHILQRIREWVALHQTQNSPRAPLPPQSSDKTFISPPNMWHILLKEPGHEVVKMQILEWLDKRTVQRAKVDKE